MLLDIYIHCTCKVEAMGPSGCIGSTRSRFRHQFTLTGAKVEICAAFFAGALECTFYPAASCIRSLLPGSASGPVHDLELPTIYMCRDQMRHRCLAHIPESEDGPAHPKRGHTYFLVSCCFVCCYCCITRRSIITMTLYIFVMYFFVSSIYRIVIINKLKVNTCRVDP